MSVLTRIKNNQITDSTILANTKIVPGSIVGSLFNANLTMTSDVTITGNLTVQGSSTYLTVASTNTYVNDPLIVMNNAFTGTNTNDIGLLFNRGSDTNQAIIWDESEDEFRLIATSETGDTYGAVTTSSYANLRLGNIAVEYIASIGTLDVVGNIGAVNLTLSGDLAVNGADITTTASTFNILTANATTVNAFTAATTLELGAASGTTNINNNLDVDGNVSIDGENLTVTASTFNLANTTATTVNAFGAATAINLGSTTGYVLINNPSVQGSQATQDLFATSATTTMNFAANATTVNIGATTGTTSIQNATVELPNATNIAVGQTSITFANTVATTVNAFGAATELNFAASSGTTTIRNDFTTPGIVTLTNSTNATGPASGALQVTGGASVGGNLYVSGNINITGSSYVITANAGVFYGDDNGFGALYAGVTGYTPLPSTVFQTTADINNYAQNNFQNINTGADASTDWVATAGDGSDYDHYIDMGIVTSNWDGTQDNSLTNALGGNDGYMYVQGNVATGQGGNLVVGASTPGTKKVSIIVGGNTASNITAVFSNPETASTTTTSGALTVKGGVGVTGNITTGNLTVAGTTTLTGNVEVDSTAQSTSTSDGAVVIAGGVGIAKNLNVGGDVVITGNLQVDGDVVTVNASTLDVEDINITVAKGAINAAAADGAGLTVDGAGATLLYEESNDSWNVNKLFNGTSAGFSGNLSVTGLVTITDDLAVNGGDLTTTATTFNLLDATATTVNAFGAATAIDLGATTGTITVNNPTVVGTQSTQNLYNTTATTLNFAGAATSLNIGATTGTLSLFNANIWLPNAVTIDGAQATVNLLGNATTVDAFKSATDLEFGATTGTLTVNNPTVVGTQSTQNLYNTTATTLNFAGAATSVVAGATSGTFSLRNANLHLPNATTIHSSQATVSLLNENVTTVNGFGAATALTLGATSGTATIRNATVTFPNATNIHVDQSSVTFANTNATTVNAFGAATELYFASVGSNTTVRGNVISSGILVGTAGIPVTEPTTNPANSSFFVQGGSVLRGNVFITEEANISYANIYANTISTSSSTGALVVTGGVGFKSNLNVSSGVVVNKDQTDQSLLVKGQYATTLIFADAVTDTVTIGGSNTTPISGATLRVNGTGAMVLPVGTTSERPGSSGNVDVRGMIRINSSLNILEYYDGTAWQSSQGSFTVINSESYNGDGANVNFTLLGESTTSSTIVAINGVVQIPSTSYSVTGNLLTFTEAPEIGDVIDVRRLSTTVTVDELGFGQNIFKANVNYSFISTGTVTTVPRLLVDTSGLVTVTGDMEIYGNLTVKGDTNGQINIGDSNTDNVAITAEINSNLVPNANNTYDLGSSTQRWRNVYNHATIHDETPTNVASNATPVLIDQFLTSAYSSAKYLVQIKAGSTVQAAELLLVQDTGNAYITTYGVLSSNVELGTFTANVSSGNVNLYYTSTTETNSNVKVHSTYIV